MGYKCTVKRIGTVLYPRNGDLLKTLSLALQVEVVTDAFMGSDMFSI